MRLARSLTLVGILCTAIAACDEPSSTAPSGTSSASGARDAGHEFAKRIVREVLKAPTTAKFPWDTVAATLEAPLVDGSGRRADRWRVRGAVDAENSFGVQIRSWWTIDVVLSEGEFIAVKAMLDEDVLFEMADYQSLVEESRQNERAQANREQREKILLAWQEAVKEAGRLESQLADFVQANSRVDAFVAVSSKLSMYRSAQDRDQVKSIIARRSVQ